MEITYKTTHFNVDNNEPKTPIDKALSDIVFAVKDRLSDAIIDEATGLYEIHPKVVIAMVITNIFVNIMYTSIAAIDTKKRLDMFDECLADINAMSLELWRSLEASRAETDTPN